MWNICPFFPQSRHVCIVCCVRGHRYDQYGDAGILMPSEREGSTGRATSPLDADTDVAAVVSTMVLVPD